MFFFSFWRLPSLVSTLLCAGSASRPRWPRQGLPEVPQAVPPHACLSIGHKDEFWSPSVEVVSAGVPHLSTEACGAFFVQRLSWGPRRRTQTVHPNPLVHAKANSSKPLPTLPTTELALLAAGRHSKPKSSAQGLGTLSHSPQHDYGGVLSIRGCPELVPEGRDGCSKRETVSWNWKTAQVSCTSRDCKSRVVSPWLSKAWQEAEIISCLQIKQKHMVRSSANLTDVVVTKSIYLHQPRSCPLSIFTNKVFFSWWMLGVFHSAAFPPVQF